MPDKHNPILIMDQISKKFDDLTAIKHACLNIRKGEIHALVGENGAGKSTLMNILYGIHRRDGGEVLLRGQKVHFSSPADAIAAGIGMVHQHFKLAPSFSVAENIILGAEPMLSLSRVDFKRARTEAAALSRQFGLELNPHALVEKLPVGLRQRVEILKALYRRAEILILDEPTAVLTPNETRELFATMRSLAQSGCSIIFISHKLREVLSVSDRISVMRRGQIMRTFDNVQITAQDLANEMVGRAVTLQVDKSGGPGTGEEILKVDGLKAYGDRGEIAVDNLSLSINAGEIVGIAGVQGNGQDELIECIAGLRQPASGSVQIGNVKNPITPRQARDAGLAYIPADRGGTGLSLQSSLWENLSVGHFDTLSKGAFLLKTRARTQAQELVDSYDVRGGGIDVPAAALSGGNQQKIQVARELSRETRLIVAEQPSQGVDIGAIESIHKIIVAMRNQGRAVLVVSADLDEIVALSDRVMVMYRGRVLADLRANETDYETLGLYMGGFDGKAEQAQKTGRAQTLSDVQPESERT